MQQRPPEVHVSFCAICAPFLEDNVRYPARDGRLSLSFFSFSFFLFAQVCIPLFSPTFQVWMKKKVGSDATDEKRFLKAKAKEKERGNMKRRASAHGVHRNRHLVFLPPSQFSASLSLFPLELVQVCSCAVLWSHWL